MKYTAVHLLFDKEKTYISDLLASHLGEIDYDSFVESETGLDAYILSAKFDENVLKKHLEDFSFEDNIAFTYDEPEEKNWNEEWEKYFLSQSLLAISV